MYSFQYPYILIGSFALVISILLCILICLSYLITKQNPSFDKLSAYECGFEAFNDTQQQQDIRYFILGLLFIIFDIELMFLFPWIAILSLQGSFTFWIGIDFLIELLIGYLVAWKLYIFDWN